MASLQVTREGALEPGDPGPNPSSTWYCVTWSKWLNLSVLSFPIYKTGLIMPTL